MKKSVIILSLVIAYLNCLSQKKVADKDKILSANVYMNTFKIRLPFTNLEADSFSYGTAFEISFDKKNYLISAKHVIPKHLISKKIIQIQIYRYYKWEIHWVEPIYPNNEQIDIVGFKLLKKISDIDLSIAPIEIPISAEIFIAGFPNNIGYNPSNLRTANNGYPIAIVKKGIISGILKFPETSFLMLDIIGNKIYSGGPVVIYDYKKEQWAVCGIISKRLLNTIQSDSLYKETGFMLAVSNSELIEMLNK